ncbi:MAG: dihydroorotate dehydrogenase electron transfer subunit [archaeon]|nr:dihydroorotate dehydrogenase electron transfer subunit [archaeon]
MSEYVKIISVKEEAYDTKTFEFEMEAEARPGQFVMIWCPGMEEIPMSLSKTVGNKAITVKRIGPDTERIHQFKVGDTLRVRGPYGNGYTFEEGKEYLIIGGGVGAASIMPAVEQSGADTIIGARSDRDLILKDRAEAASKNVWYSTDDGSFGFHGNAVQLMKEKYALKKYDCVVACGPEGMLFFLYKACQELGVDCQLSLERHMKCGAGVCGCCVMDKQRVCKDGPVFTAAQIAQMKDFGVCKRDDCGRVVNFRK